MMLMDSHSSEEDLANLRKLILTSTQLNTQFLIDKLEETDLMYERAILHGRLKQYDRALDILVNKMNDHSLALRLEVYKFPFCPVLSLSLYAVFRILLESDFMTKYQ